LATFSPALTTLVVDMGLGEHIIGVTSQETVPLPGRAILGDVMNVSTEAILAARPDILLVQMADKNFSAVQSSNREIKVEHFDIETLDDIGLAMERIAHLVGRDEVSCRAKALFWDRLGRVAAKVAGRPRPKVLFVIGYQDNISTVGGNTFVGQMIQAAGGQNVAAGMSGWIGTNRDYVLSKAPDVVVCWTDPGQEAAAKAHWSSLPGLPAAAAGRVYAVSDRYWTIPTGRTAALVESLAEMIHPELQGEAASVPAWQIQDGPATQWWDAHATGGN
jgi:iron complex transport system substrate-binding protein